MKRLLRNILPGLFLFGAAMSAPVTAATVPYQNAGTEEPYNYLFYAAVTGPLNLYLAPSDAGYDNELFITINSTTTDTHLHSHGTVGDMFSIGTTAGDLISFSIVNPGGTFSSVTGNNADGFHHLYYSPYTSNPFLLPVNPLQPLTNYYAFEDLRGGGDKDYNDLTFVSSRVTAAVPEPSTWAMMLAGFIGLGLMTRRRARPSLA